MKLILSIVERGQGAALVRLYRKRQAPIHIQCAGKGTATSEIMEILGLGSSEKDVVLSFAAASAAKKLLHDLDNELRGRTGGAGIVVSIPVSALNSLVANLAAYHAESLKEKEEDREMERTENSLILVVCARGCTDDVMSTAKAHGARGGTVIKGRLSGREELEEAYEVDLKAEREIVAIVVPTGLRGPIMEAINAEHGLRSEAQAALCSLPIEQIVRLG
jgi:phosphotransferase system HPr-like phosphotransfer protein